MVMVVNGVVRRLLEWERNRRGSGILASREEEICCCSLSIIVTDSRIRRTMLEQRASGEEIETKIYQTAVRDVWRTCTADLGGFEVL